MLMKGYFYLPIWVYRYHGIIYLNIYCLWLANAHFGIHRTTCRQVYIIYSVQPKYTYYN